MHWFAQIFAHGFTVYVELLRDGRNAPALLLQISHVHKILQSEHRASFRRAQQQSRPERVWPDDRLHLGKFQPAEVGNFRPALLGNFESALLGNLQLALTLTETSPTCSSVCS